MDEVNKSGTYASYETYKEAFDAEVKRTELGLSLIHIYYRLCWLSEHRTQILPINL